MSTGKARRPSVVLAALLALVVGCTLTQTDLRKGADDLAQLGRAAVGGKAGGTGKSWVFPRQCALRMAVLARPIPDEALGSELWQLADARVVGDDVRRSLTDNGLRLGVVTGELPGGVRAILDATAQQPVVVLPDGESTLFDPGATKAELDLLLNRGGSVGGKRYTDTHGFVRLTAKQEEDGSLSLRVVPELHHGPVTQGWGVAPGGGSYAPQQLIMHNGQAEETFRELAATISIRPGQVVALSALPERKGSLGHFLFTAPEANSDRMVQKVLLIWASKFEPGSPESESVAPGDLVPVEPPDLPRGESDAAAVGDGEETESPVPNLDPGSDAGKTPAGGAVSPAGANSR